MQNAAKCWSGNTNRGGQQGQMPLAGQPRGGPGAGPNGQGPMNNGPPPMQM